MLILVFVCVGCVHRHRVVRPVVSECEARWADVAVAVDARPVCQKITPDTYEYLSSFDKEILQLFYHQEMERLGWDSVAVHDGLECVSLFRKPAQFCVVSMRKHGKHLLVRLDRFKKLYDI